MVRDMKTSSEVSSQKQHNIAAPILVLIVVGMVSLAVISSVTTYLSFYNESINTMRQQNRALINRIDGWIALKGSLLEYNAMLLRNLNLDQQMTFALLTTIIEVNEDVSDVYLGFPDGTGFSILGNPFPPGWVAYGRPWYIEAAQRPGELVFTSPYMDIILNRLAFASVRTIDNYDDSRGVVALRVPFTTMASYVAQANEMADSFSFILDTGGNILLHPDPAFIPLDEFTFQDIHEVEDGRYAKMFAAIMEGGFYAGDNAVYVGMALATTGWYVITRIPTSYIMDNVFTTLLSIIAKALLAVISLIVTGVALRMIKASMDRKQDVNEINEIFINSSPFIMNIWDDTYKLVATSQQSVEIFGLSSQEQYLERFYELSPQYQPCGTNSREKAINFVKDAFREGRAKYEWLHQTLDGEPLPTEITLVRFMRQGKYMVAAYTSDLRPAKAAMEKEREAEARVKLVLDTSPLCCYLLDENRRAIDCNQAAIELFVRRPGRPLVETYPEQKDFERCKLLNCRNCENIGRKNTCFALDYLVKNYRYTFPDYEQNKEKIEQSMAECCDKALKDGVHRFEFPAVSLYGETIPCEVTIVPVKFREGRGFAVYLRDLREEKRREIAEEENQAKSRFLARMSHEIRTPMNAVLGIAEVQLQKKIHPPETEEAFSRIYSSSNLLLTIINDILDMSKVESGKMEIIPVVYETAIMIVDTVQLNLMHVGSKRIEFNLSVDENLPSYLIGDELRIKQIMNNLLSNAFKYTAEGNVKLSIGLEDTPQSDKVTLVICVSDTGQGMTNEDIDNLFNAEFIRFNTQSNRTIQGSGLGMSIAHSFVMMMHGDIKVESSPGKGSTFTIRIPQKRQGEHLLGKEAAENLQKLENIQKFRKRIDKFALDPMPYGRVLVVDDVDINLYVVEGILASYEIAVETAESGPEAIAKIENGEVYDIIFMDHMMPGMNGIEAAKIIRDTGYAHPIVALTANALKDSAEMFMSHGFSGFISKPIDIGKLNAYLTRFIRDKHLAKTD